MVKSSRFNVGKSKRSMFKKIENIRNDRSGFTISYENILGERINARVESDKRVSK